MIPKYPKMISKFSKKIPKYSEMAAKYLEMIFEYQEISPKSLQTLFLEGLEPKRLFFPRAKFISAWI
jgi:hypothetical protein